MKQATSPKVLMPEVCIWLAASATGAAETDRMEIFAGLREEGTI
jgi:hypothetical protein